MLLPLKYWIWADPVELRKTIPSPRLCAGVGVAPWPAGATTSNSATSGLVTSELKGPHTFGRLNGVNVTLEPTDLKPSLATAISGPSSTPHGCSRLRAGTITLPAACLITVEPGSLPSTAIWSHVT